MHRMNQFWALQNQNTIFFFFLSQTQVRHSKIGTFVLLRVQMSQARGYEFFSLLYEQNEIHFSSLIKDKLTFK